MTGDSAVPRSGSPLRGVTVLELGQFIAGPFAGQQLADLGAEVIKIERPGQGDPFRQFAASPGPGGYGHNFRALNRNKLGVAIDLRHPRGRDVLKRLAGGADVGAGKLPPRCPRSPGARPPGGSGGTILA